MSETLRPSPMTLLIDDVRSFRNERSCCVARSSVAGVALLTELQGTYVDHLWLDHDLVGDDTIWPVVRLLEDAADRGRPFDVGVIHVHASRSGPAHEMLVALRRAGYCVERSVNLRLWAY